MSAMLPSLMPLAYRLRRRVLALLGWRTRGVKLIVTDAAGRVLLVRHAYGRSDLYMLPGGGIARGEAPAAAAARELREETGCRARDVTLFAAYESRTEGRRDTVFLFTARSDDPPVPDGRELLEARFVAADALPDATSPATRRRIAAWRARDSRSTAW
jgi:8-oxo-dGTP pyrophosphatase MutT (NUDIX family)